jgi:hypothetical protein
MTVQKAEAIREQMMDKVRQAIAHNKSEALKREPWRSIQNGSTQRLTL